MINYGTSPSWDAEIYAAIEGQAKNSVMPASMAYRAGSESFGSGMFCTAHSPNQTYSARYAYDIVIHHDELIQAV